MSLSPFEHWQDALAEIEEMKAGVHGARDDDERQDILAEDLHRRGADPVLLKALMAPDDEPPITLQDAKEMYRKRRVEGSSGRYNRNQLERVCGRLEKALGPLHKLPLVDLKRAHGRKLEAV